MPKVMKRSAASELNSDNWDQDDEPEDAGTFKPVNQEELSKRVIKVAKRRLPTSKTGDEAKPLFSNFTGFGTASSGGKSSFSFLSNLNGSNSQSASQSKETESESSAQKPQEISSKKSEENAYLESLKSLNKCLLDWVDQCIKKNASCILTPIFKDYEKHLESLKKPVAGEEKSPKKPVESMSSFKFNSANNAGSQNTSSSTTTLQNSISPMSLSMTTTPSLKFNVPISSSTTGSWLSSSTVSKPSIFSSLGSSTNTTMATTTLPTPTFGIFSTSSNPITTPSTDSENKDGGDDDETPPVNDFKPVTEDDALFSQRVKLFVQKDKQYSDRGVGMLYIKEAKDAKGNKIHQAIIRADTSLGNIIFNIRINSDIPTKRVGKNNVMLVCLPTPDAKPPPVPVLLRVKTAEEADKLLEEIDKYK